MSVRSEPGRGSSFVVLLPSLQRAAPQRAPVERARLARWSGTVLVIEDEAEVRALLMRLLERAGFEVLGAAEGTTGIELFRTLSARLRCVFLDLTMPGVNGEMVLHELKQLAPAVPVVMMSGFAAEEVAQRFGGEGMAAFLPKPFTPASVEAILRSVLTPEP